jgi:hypothetical protein
MKKEVAIRKSRRSTRRAVGYRETEMGIDQQCT